MDGVITRGAWSLVTLELVRCDPGDTFIHWGHDAFAASFFLGVVPALGWCRHFLSVFLHEVMSHRGHCFGNVKIVIPLSMAGS